MPANTLFIECDCLPSDDPTFQVVDLDEFSKAAGVIVVSSFRVSKCLQNKNTMQRHVKRMAAINIY